jgi:hypothetical protein
MWQWWGEEFCDYVNSLEHFAVTVPEEDPVFWICSFAVCEDLLYVDYR